MAVDIKKIIKQMTLEEKAGLCSGLDFWHTKPVERLGIPSIMMTDGPHGLRKQRKMQRLRTSTTAFQQPVFRLQQVWHVPGTENWLRE